MMYQSAVTILLLLCMVAEIDADFENGLKAYDQGDYAKAFAEWLPLAEQGNAVAQRLVSLFFEFGITVVPDDDVARKWLEKSGMPISAKPVNESDLQNPAAGKLFERLKAYDYAEYYGKTDAIIWCKKAAERGDILAAFELGNYYWLKFENAKAIIYFQQAAKQGSLLAYLRLADIYMEGHHGLSRNVEMGLYWFKKAEERGVAVAANNLGNIFFYGDLELGIKQDYSEAKRWYSSAMRRTTNQIILGNVFTKFGMMYDQGLGVPEDSHEAATWYQKAAEQGNAKSQSIMGIRYYYGKGVPKDISEAVKWIQKGAEQGDPTGQSVLGRLYYFGDGLPKNLKEAAKWYSLAAKSGDTLAQSSLGGMYINGEGVIQDYVEAAKWSRLAATQGDPAAQYNLGLLYSSGSGVPRDVVFAYLWYNLAAVNEGDEKLAAESRAMRDSIAQQMTPAQISKAQELSRNWRVGVGSEDQTASAPSIPKSPNQKGAARSDPQTLRPSGSGTGFIVSPQGHVLTNNHVVEGCSVLKTELAGQQQTLFVLGRDAQNDLALLKFGRSTSTFLSFSPDRTTMLGQTVIVLGYPLRGLLASSINVSTGTISALAGIQDDTRILQFTAPIQPGNSGGPLLDQSGNVVGVATSKLNAVRLSKYIGDIPQNVNFAIKSHIARSFLDSFGVSYSPGPSSVNLGTSAIIERSKNAVIPIECLK